MRYQPINRDTFLHTVQPALLRADMQELCDTVRHHWAPMQLCSLLTDDSADTRRLACLALGLIGDRHLCNCLAHALRDADAHVAHLAEHALWSIWLRSGASHVSGTFRTALDAMESGQLTLAVEQLHHVVEADPGFAEAYNQCAIAHYLLEQWEQAITDGRQATELMPVHFGAWAGMGHAHVQLGAMDQAAQCYRRALKIHPRTPEIASALNRIERCGADLAVSITDGPITRPIQ